MKGDCNICVNGKLPLDSAICVDCGLSRKNYKPVTNYDLLARKTPEEMAYFMANIEPCRESAWLDWLKDEASDD